MTTRFDPEAGVLQVRHAALSLMARLAVNPTDPALIDHATAEPLAELRSAGILTNSGIHPAVAPLATAIGTAATRWNLAADDHGRAADYPVWVQPDLAVIGVPVEEDTWALMADRPDMLPELIGELVGLGTAPEITVTGTRELPRSAWDELVASGQQTIGTQVVDALSTTPDDRWVAAVTNALVGAGVRWHLRTDSAGLEVLDAGLAGLWSARLHGDTVHLGPTTARDVRGWIATQLDAALNSPELNSPELNAPEQTSAQ